MWQSTWTCRVDSRECYPVVRVRPEHPVTSAEEKPRCTDHGEPMVLQGYDSTEEKPKPKKTVRWRKGGFRAEQRELF